MANYNDYLNYLQHIDNITKQEVTAKIDSLNKEITNLKTSLANLNKEKDTLADDLVKAKTDLLNEEITNLKTSLANLNKEKDILADDLAKANRQINEQKNTINQAKAEKEEELKEKIRFINEHPFIKALFLPWVTSRLKKGKTNPHIDTDLYQWAKDNAKTISSFQKIGYTLILATLIAWAIFGGKKGKIDQDKDDSDHIYEVLKNAKILGQSGLTEKDIYSAKELRKSMKNGVAYRDAIKNLTVNKRPHFSVEDYNPNKPFEV